MNTPTKAARGASRGGPCVKVPQGISVDLCQAPQRSEVVRGDFGQRRCGGACFTNVHTCVYQMFGVSVGGGGGSKSRWTPEPEDVREEIQQGAGYPKMSETDVLRESDEVLTTRLKKEFNRCFLNYQHVAEQYK